MIAIVSHISIYGIRDASWLGHIGSNLIPGPTLVVVETVGLEFFLVHLVHEFPNLDNARPVARVLVVVGLRRQRL